MYAAKTAAAAAANVGGHDGQGKIWKTSIQISIVLIFQEFALFHCLLIGNIKKKQKQKKT